MAAGDSHESAAALASTGAGLTDLVTWVVKVEEHYDFIKAAVANETRDVDRQRQALLTLHHEAVHFLQGLTTAYTRALSSNLFTLCLLTTQLTAQGRLTAEQLVMNRRAYRDLIGELRREHDGVTPLDLLEAMAVAETFQACLRYQDPESWDHYMAPLRAMGATPYTRIIDAVQEEFGPERAIHWTSKLAFMALNGEDPGRLYGEIVSRIRPYAAGLPPAVTTVQLAHTVGIDPRALHPARFLQVKPKGMDHIFRPHLEGIVALGSSLDVLELVSHPGDYLRPGGSEFNFEAVVPPVVIPAGGRFSIMGLAQEWPEEHLHMLLDLTSIVGACLRLFGEPPNYLSCEHRECPLYTDALCHTHSPPSTNLTWEDCRFHFIEKERFGATHERLCGALQTADALEQKT